MHFLTFGKLPDVDEQGPAEIRLRPPDPRKLRAARRTSTPAASRWKFGDEGHRKGYCLYKLGCKGPETYANCPSILFGDVGAPAGRSALGHPCIGCTEKGIGFTKPIHALAELKNVVPPAGYPRIVEEKGNGATVGAVAVAAARGRCGSWRRCGDGEESRARTCRARRITGR